MVREMPQSQRTCAPVRCVSSAPYVCETETRSGGPGKDTRLGKLEGGLTLLEGSFSFGQHTVLVPLLSLPQEAVPVNSRAVFGRRKVLVSVALESLTLVEIWLLQTVCSAGMLVE